MIDHNLTGEQEIRAEAGSPYGVPFLRSSSPLTIAEYALRDVTVRP